MIKFAIIGAGWRSEFFARVARELPDRFQMTGLLSRSREKADSFGQTWHVSVATSLDELLTVQPDFALVSVPWGVGEELVIELSRRGVPVLYETPPSPTLEGLRALHEALKSLPAKVQVAEQYHLQPLHAARLEAIKQGWIGTPNFARVSVAHGYHGISLLRRFLGIGFELPTITARHFKSPLINGPGRDGPPQEEKTIESDQLLATFDWGEKLGSFDFCGDQYFSWVRGQDLLVRGERGEVHNEEIRLLQDYQTPLKIILQRETAGANGNLEGFYLKGLTARGQWLYQNPFMPARLSDDEIACAACLQGMKTYLETGKDFYSLAEAMHDRYLDILMDEAAQKGEAMRAEFQPWMI
ncbi:MAG TPA: Gfo/Idh/MocA family oxidoreductase [Abditibacteriaceae bacterium]